MSGCDTSSAINVDEIIPTLQDFMKSVSVIQALSIFWLITRKVDG